MTARSISVATATFAVLYGIVVNQPAALQVFRWTLGAIAAVCVLWLVVWFLSPGLMAHVDDEAAEITR